jgi:hypothetical protein
MGDQHSRRTPTSKVHRGPAAPERGDDGGLWAATALS